MLSHFNPSQWSFEVGVYQPHYIDEETEANLSNDLAKEAQLVSNCFWPELAQVQARCPNSHVAALLGLQKMPNNDLYGNRIYKRVDVYMYNWFTLLYTWNQHNIVDQLYSNKN